MLYPYRVGRTKEDKPVTGFGLKYSLIYSISTEICSPFFVLDILFVQEIKAKSGAFFMPTLTLLAVFID
jgi:hypothetical protein